MRRHSFSHPTQFSITARRRYDDAERLLLHVLQVDPGNKVAEMLLEQLAGRPR